MSSVLVTGATGFLGKHVVECLSAAGWRVVGASLQGGAVGDVEVLAIDLAERQGALGLLRRTRYDAVVHLAAALPEGSTPDAMQACFDSTVATMATVVTLCRLEGLRLVYASGTSVYGSIADGVAATEERLPAPETLYTAAKYFGDVLCLQLTHETGIPAAALRISAPYGPGIRRPTVVDTFVRAALESRDLAVQGTGSRTQDFTYVGDVADAVERALAARASGIFNVATGRPVTMRELAETVLEAVPGTGSRVVSSGDVDPQEHHRTLIDVSKARERLGWSARIELIDGLRATGVWLESVQ